MKEEFSGVPPEAWDFIRVSRSLPSGMAFGNAEFRAELLRYFDAWPFQMLVVDPWNDVSSDDGQSDYKEALQNIRRTFIGRQMPCLVIVAHLRKPRNDSSGRRKSGRELLHELSGSLALGSTSRTVFAVQPATAAMDDDRVIFEVSKANDCNPEWLKECGVRSAWHRKNGAFEPCHEIDWEQWDNPGNEDKRAITLDMLEAAFDGAASEMKTSEIVRRIKTQNGVGESTVFRAVGENGYLRAHLVPGVRGAFQVEGMNKEFNFTEPPLKKRLRFRSGRKAVYEYGYCTGGEIMQTFRLATGEYREVTGCKF